MSLEFPQSNFTVDEIVVKGHDRREVISTLQKMEREGKGVFIIGRRGSKSRWQWSRTQLAYPPPTISVKPPVFTPVATLDDFIGSLQEDQEMVVDLTPSPTFEPQEKKPDLIPLSWIQDNGWSFWNPTQREAIAKELLSFRKMVGK